MTRTVAWAGFLSAAAALAAVVGYGVAQVAQVVGVIGYPIADVLIYATSLAICVPFLIGLLAVSEAAVPERRVWMRGALLFGAMYVAFAALTYTTQLSVVMPRAPARPDTGVLGMGPHSLFWNIDALAYLAMGLAAACAGLALPARSPTLWLRRFLLAHGAVLPLIAVAYYYPHFSVAVLFLGSPWLVTATGSMLALTLYFGAALRDRLA